MNIKINEVFSVGTRAPSERQGLNNFIKASVLALGLAAGSAAAQEAPSQDNMRPITEYNKDMVVVAKIHHIGFGPESHTPTQNYYELDRGTWNVSENQDVRQAFKGQGKNSEFQLVLLDPKTRETIMVDVPGDVYSNHCVDGDFRVDKKAKTLIAACDEDQQSMVATMAYNQDGSGEHLSELTERTPYELTESGEFITSSDIKERLLEKRYLQENPLRKNNSVYSKID